ncbi:hypothetical protein M0R72_06815 [Candidatus Pacearchaeota archaeon]|jgi:hypothetical protein|nr:hypothetical protein [Candidatus Pacearchaeota archaeon]
MDNWKLSEPYNLGDVVSHLIWIMPKFYGPRRLSDLAKDHEFWEVKAAYP